MKKRLHFNRPGPEVVLNLLAFAIGLALAYALDWQARDLIWSLWLSSLVTGYLTIVIRIGRGLSGRTALLRQQGSPAQGRIVFATARTLLAVFLLGFFSLHFCGFHAGHAVFLSQFFPLPGVNGQDFSSAFMNPLLLWKTAITSIVPMYGLFLIPVFINERKYILGTPLKDGEKKTTSRRQLSDAFSRPYINVVRMHLLIFFFAFSATMALPTTAVMIVVYAVYFFPWSECFTRQAETAPDQTEGITDLA